MSVCQQRDIRALCPSVQFCWGPARKRSVCCKSGVFIRTVMSRKVPVPPCAGSRLMRFILKVPERFLLAIHFVPMAVVPTLIAQNIKYICHFALYRVTQTEKAYFVL
ncbi:hypothetical protein ILYODFUR_026950 [Ilyodon furcidens]|uniref:Uncharacterized protein n=1 Tax=Ilyodon furcidens TaxID=33524 RepID=A0ABV0T3T2_9TELE